MTQMPTQSMSEDNNAANGSNDAETNDESTARKFEDPVRNFLGRLAGDEEESETEDAAEQGESYAPPEEPHYVSQCKVCGLYHAGILTESGSDSTHLAPQTDMWELEPDFGGDL